MTSYYYFLVWGHGIPHLDDILDIIRDADRVKIRKILIRRVSSIRRLVKSVYSMDYAPFQHLKAKTRYLLTTPAEVALVFVAIDEAQTDFFGEGAFRHMESLEIRALKDEIRSRLNPRRDGGCSEDHVVHASDNELQTAHMLRLLGYREGLGLFCQRQSIINAPYYLGPCRRFEIRRLPVENLFCNVLQGDRENYSSQCVPVQDSPHFRGLQMDMQIYGNYIKCFRGGALTEDYSVARFQRLAHELRYLDEPHDDSFVIVKAAGDQMVIHDGLHRAAILQSRGGGTVPVAVI